MGKKKRSLAKADMAKLMEKYCADAVPFLPGRTECPICNWAGYALAEQCTRVYRTVGPVHYMTCLRCSRELGTAIHFKAEDAAEAKAYAERARSEAEAEAAVRLRIASKLCDIRTAAARRAIRELREARQGEKDMRATVQALRKLGAADEEA